MSGKAVSRAIAEDIDRSEWTLATVATQSLDCAFCETMGVRLMGTFANAWNGFVLRSHDREKGARPWKCCRSAEQTHPETRL